VCRNACAADADCASPAVCINGSCGLKGPGKPCADGTECLSHFCAQGFCCNSACNGTCQSCGLPGTLGTCTSVPNGAADPQGTCQNKGQASCDTDGLCDGRGACRFYAAGTECVPPSCPANLSTLTQARTCDGVGNCQAASTIACAPFKCNGSTACNAACTTDADCLAPNICDPKTNLCGDKKRLGQPCNATADCLTGNFCVDGVCCGSSACGLCQACDVQGKAGACSDVGAGVTEPHGGCAASPPCGNTGACDGAGACEQAGANVSCGSPSCSVSTYTSISHCTGDGACATPVMGSCSPYVCGGNACKTTCTVDGDCLAPYTCQGTAGAKSCALKKNGLGCTGDGQCISGHCVDGVCCGTADCPACTACNLSGNGACSPVPAGTQAPVSFCPDEGAKSCGSTGKCDGNGGCQQYPKGTPCSDASCPASGTTLTMAGTCDSGMCVKPTQSCAPYFCNGVAACQGTCSGDSDCQTGYYCTGVGGSCVVKKDNGDTCTAGNQCKLGNCVDKICCATASCTNCKACNVTGSLGTCAPMNAGSIDPNGTCTAQDPTTCGTDGKCDGAGGCQKYADGTTCSQTTCQSTTTLKLEGKCSGGACNAGTMACAPYMCTNDACAKTCNTDGECASGTYCSGPGGTCTAKKDNGEVCDPAKPNQCAFGHCVDGVCCDTACTGACVSCALPTKVGTCTDVGAGAPDPRAVCPDLSPAKCSTNGKCDGMGGCQNYAPATKCSDQSCDPLGSIHTLDGTCATGTCAATTASCGAYMCDTDGDCRTSCTLDTDCVVGKYCSGGQCVDKLAKGKMCSGGNQCGTGNCVESVCCDSAACGQCQSCAIAGSLGECTSVGAGNADPSLTCKNDGFMTCGHNGKCENDDSCQFYGGATMCAAALCSGNQISSDRFCDGAGHCPAATVTNCGAYNCKDTMTCYGDCTNDGDGHCATGSTCDGMSCN
jgi:hypothetical protein